MTPEDSLPWHATLFSHEDGDWNFFCGGTLIAERLILTAGHCVWKTEPDTIKVFYTLNMVNDNLEKYYGLNNRIYLFTVIKNNKIDIFQVALASYSSNFTDHDENTQIMDPERIELQDSYQDHEGNYNSDVALLILKKPVTINSLVRPVCIDWENTLNTSQRSGEIGLVSGNKIKLKIQLLC